jgi:hypothetical protein
VCCTWDNSFPAKVEYQEAIVYYLGYCLVFQCLLPGILPYLPVCITWGISSSANVYYLIDIALPVSAYYLGYFLVCQCVLPWILPCLPMCVIWDKALSVNFLPGVCIVCQFVLPRKLLFLLMGDMGLSRLLVFITEDMLPVCLTWGISSSANVYYLIDIALPASAYYLVLFSRLPMCITLDIALSANVCYLG